MTAAQEEYPMAEFAGKTLLVTGAATGLGRAVALLAAKSGAKVAVLDINETEGRQTAADAGGRFWRLDVADPAAWEAVVTDIERELGAIHFAHLNAGIMTQGLGESLAGANIESLGPDRYRQVVGVNVDGVFFGLQTLLPRMNQDAGEAVTVTSSAAGLIPIPFDPVYALTKHAVIGLVRSLALAYAGARTRINAICPGGFASPLLPPEFRTATTMSSEQMAAEVLDLLLTGATGETRLKLRGDAPAEAIAPPRSSLG